MSLERVYDYFRNYDKQIIVVAFYDKIHIIN